MDSDGFTWHIMSPGSSDSSGTSILVSPEEAGFLAAPPEQEREYPIGQDIRGVSHIHPAKKCKEDVVECLLSLFEQVLDILIFSSS